MYDRAVRLDIEREFCDVGRIIGKVSEKPLIEKTLQSSALGQNFFYILETEGRVQVDIMKVVQRDFKLDMYKLDFVAETFLKSNKVDLGPKELFAKFREGGSANIKDIAVYCVQDCELCNRLMNKLEIITNNVGMGNVCHVPFYWLFLRGQGVKIYSLVARQCRLEEFLLKVQSKGSDEDKGYEGAVVLVATPGIYMVPVSVNDFASLYPSSMISENISHDSIVFYKVYDNSGNIVNMQNEKPGWYSLPEYRANDDPASTKKLDKYFKEM
jgi:DNA polymerase delta subunit 1